MTSRSNSWVVILSQIEQQLPEMVKTTPFETFWFPLGSPLQKNSKKLLRSHVSVLELCGLFRNKYKNHTMIARIDQKFV